MDIKKVEKANKIIVRIKEIDKEIIEIDKFAIMAANGVVKSHIELFIEDKASPKEDSKSNIFDEDGSIKTSREINGYLRGFSFGLYNPISRIGVNVKKENEHTFKTELHEKTILHLLSLLLQDKNHRRNYLISLLEKIGVKIN